MNFYWIQDLFFILTILLYRADTTSCVYTGWHLFPITILLYLADAKN